MLNFPNASPEEELNPVTAAKPAKVTTVKTAEEVRPTHAVLYTDGGCRPSRGIGGWGIHGYFYRDEKAKAGAGIPNWIPTREGYAPGSGIPDITITHYVDGFGAELPETTNNRAEIMGAIKAMQVIAEHSLVGACMILDSKYVLDGMTDWMSGWASTNWRKGDGQEVGNADLWRILHSMKTALDENGVKFEFQWVKGHSGNLGNHLADHNAIRAIHVGRRNYGNEVIKVEDAKGYWNFKPERSRMLSHPQWYFAAGAAESYKSDDGRHVYYLGDPREEEELLGKKIAQATFSVVYLKEPEPILNFVRDEVARMGGDQYQALTIGHLRKLFQPDIYEELTKHGDLLLNYDSNGHRLMLWNHGEEDLRGEKIDTVLCKDIRPARLAYRAIEALQSLERVLKFYLNPSEGSLVRKTVITDLLYESDTSKKKPTFKLKPHITSALRSIDVDAGHAKSDGTDGTAKLCLTLSLDLPDRNTLAALAGEDTKVTLLTWPESEFAIRYAVVIEADGDVGIWSGIYANLHMLAP